LFAWDQYRKLLALTREGAAIARWGYNIVEDSVVYDQRSTILHLMGLDHTKLTYRFQRRDFRLTHVPGELVRKFTQ